MTTQNTTGEAAATFRDAQQRVLDRYRVSAESRFVEVPLDRRAGAGARSIGAGLGARYQCALGLTFFDDVVEAVAAQDVRVIAQAMDVVGQRERYRYPDPPHSVVLQHLLERIDECATDLGEHALVIADEVDGQAKHRADLSTYRNVGTAGYRHRRLTRIVDTLHFAPSHASRLVQAADVITFLYRRVFTHQEADSRSKRAKVAMWSRLRPRVHHERCWFPSSSGGQQRSWGRNLSLP
jgi:hypothetical protein